MIREVNVEFLLTAADGHSGSNPGLPCFVSPDEIHPRPRDDPRNWPAVDGEGVKARLARRPTGGSDEARQGMESHGAQVSDDEH